MELIHKLKRTAPIIAAMLTAFCVGTALTDYEAPIYAAGPQELAASNDAGNKTIKKLAQKQLPSREGKNAGSARGSTSMGTASDPGEYWDGTYTGTAMGFRGPITVKVTIREGEIAAIRITKTSDDGAYLQRASAVINRIIKSQNSNVDTVSGATYSSVGIIKAVRNALEKAAERSEKSGQTGKSDHSGSEEKPGTQNSDQPDTPAAAGKVTKQGDFYTVTVSCRPDSGKQFQPYELTVRAKIIKMEIKSIEIVRSTGTKTDEMYWTTACEEINSGMPSESADKISAVSGATCSSRSIKAACRLLLEEAKKDAASGGSVEQPEPEPGSDSDDSKNDDSNDGENGADTENPSDQDKEPGTDEDAVGTPDKVYQDGIYTAAATCCWQEAYCFDDDWNDYPLTVTVVIADDQIVEISSAVQTGGTGASTNRAYISRARKGINGKLPVNSGDAIDTVSGATCSSMAIKEACASALEQAKTAKGE